MRKSFLVLFFKKERLPCFNMLFSWVVLSDGNKGGKTGTSNTRPYFFVKKS